MPFTVTFMDEGRERTLNNVTKLEGMWSSGGQLTGYCLYTGSRPTEHRRAGVVPLQDVLNIHAWLPKPDDHGSAQGR